MSLNTSRDKSQGTVVPFYLAIHAARLVQMPSKRKKSCPFSSASARQKKPEKSFSPDWAENLAECNMEQWLKELNEQPSTECNLLVSKSTFSARQSKITVEEPLEDLESENTETWRKLLDHAINESVTCRFCQRSVELVENLRTWFHVDVPVPGRKLSIARN